MSDPVVGFIDQSGGKSTFEIDFGALKAKASEMLDAVPEVAPPVVEPPAAPVVVDPTTTRVKGASEDKALPPAEAKALPVEPAKVEPVVDTAAATQKQLATLSDDDMVSVPVDGEDTVMTWKEAKAGFSRTAKFTKSMQQVARDREEVAANKAHTSHLETERAGLENFLRSPNAILNYVVQTFGPQALAALTGAPMQAQPAGRNPDEIITAGEAQAMAVAERQQVEGQIQNMVQNVEKRIQTATAEIEQRQQQAKHAVAISSTLTDIFTSNPMLKSIPNAEDLIRYEVAQLKPTTEAEALEGFRNVAQGMVEDIGKHFKAQQKIAKVAEVKAKLESKSIEPPGGSAPQLKPATYKNTDGSVNWNAVRDMAIQYEQ